MSYTISEVQPLCPDGSPRVGWVGYLVVLSDGRYARTGVWINGAHSVEPTVNADGSARSLSGGVYVGWSADDSAPYDPADWWDFDPALTGDSAALAEIASTASDPTIVAAIATALSGQPQVKYGTSVGTPSPSTVSLSHPGDLTSASVAVTNPVDGGTDSIYDPFVWTSSDTSVATVVDTSSTGINSCQITEVAAGTCTVTGTTGSRAAPVLTCSIPVTCS